MRKFRAKYPGRCACGCGMGFAPGAVIVGKPRNYKVASHVVPLAKKPEQMKLF